MRGIHCERILRQGVDVGRNAIIFRSWPNKGEIRCSWTECCCRCVPWVRCSSAAVPRGSIMLSSPPGNRSILNG